MALVPVAPASTTVESRPLPFVPQRGPDSTAPFGGAQAEAFTGLAGQIGRSALTMSHIAANWALEDDTRAAKAADVKLQQAYRRLVVYSDTPGDPTPYLGMKGEAAISNHGRVEKQLALLRDQFAQELPEGRARDMFMAQASSRVESMANTVASHALRERTAAQDAIAGARIGAAIDDATTRYNDDRVLQSSVATIRSELETQARLNGWAPEVLADKLRTALGKTYNDAITARLHSGDVNGAVDMFKRYGGSMDAASFLQVQQRLEKPMRDARAGQDVIDMMGGQVPRTGGVADTTMSPAQQNFLNTVAGPESGGKYNARYPGTTFDDYRQHPKIKTVIQSGPYAGKTSDAAGRYQFLNSTWEPIARELGLPDFSPASQDKAAWHLASREYKNRTGRDLKADLESGGHGDAISAALKTVWPSMPGGDQQGISRGAFNRGLASNTAPIDRARPDFEGALAKGEAAFGNDQARFQAFATRLNQMRSTYDLSTRSEREALGKLVPDLEAQLAAGETPRDGIPRARIMAAFPAEVARAHIDRLDEAEAFGQVAQSIKFAPVEAHAADRQKLLDGLQGGAESQGYARRLRHLARFDQAWAERIEQTKKDPAAYVRSHPLVAEAYRNAKTPADLQAAVSLSLTTQRAMGVGDLDLRVLTKTEAGDTVKQLHSIPPEQGGAGARLDKLQQQYGSAWGAVVKDLVAAGMAPLYQALIAMSTKDQIAYRADAERAAMAAHNEKADFGKSIPPLVKTAMDRQIETSLLPMRETLKAYSSNEMFTRVVFPMVTTLATHYAVQGMPGEKAAIRAYDAVIGLKYEFDGKLMAPKEFNGKPLGTAGVVEAGYRLTSSMTDADLSGTTAAQAKRHGQWVLAPDGAGAVLVKETTQGGFMPILRANGQAVAMRFADMPAASAVQTTIPRPPPERRSAGPRSTWQATPE